MKTARQHEDTLGHVALLLEQQRYDEALQILGDLMKENPSDREVRIYRLLLVRILVLRHSLTRSTTAPAKYSGAIAGVITTAASALRAFPFYKMPRLTAGTSQPAKTSLGDRDSQSSSELAQLTHQVGELSTKNKELLEEINSLSSQLAARERTVEDLQKKMQQGTRSANHRLQAADQELQQEIADIKQQLQRSETRLSESASQNQELTDRNWELQTEVLELKEQLRLREKRIAEFQTEQERLTDVKFENQQLQQEIASLRKQLQWSERLQNELTEVEQQLEESQTKVRELETVQQQLADVESREHMFRRQQQELETQISDFQRELSARNETVQELEATQQRLAQMEHLCQELREDNRQLEEEISGWQERLAQSEEYQRQLSLLRQQLDPLQTKQAPLAARPSALERRSRTNVELTPVSIEPSVTYQIKPAVHTVGRPESRFAIIAVMVVLAITGTVGLGLLGTSSGKFSTSKQPSVAPEIISDKQPIPTEAPAKTPRRPGLASVTAAEKNKPSRQPQARKPAPRLRGTFETIRPTRVYRGPSELSQVVATIDAGTEITVVDSRDGWLEIRSKYGRPPGFVRQEAAVRVDNTAG